MHVCVRCTELDDQIAYLQLRLPEVTDEIAIDGMRWWSWGKAC